MDIQWFTVLAFLYAALEKARSQITAPTENEQQCFAGIMKGSCSQTDGRIFIEELVAGTKNMSLYPGTCPYTHQVGVAPECCVKGTDDCYGEYIPINVDPYVYHKDCTGKNICQGIQAARMDSLFLNCNQSIYPAVTTYFEMVFYCIDVNNIGELSNAKKQNDEHGSTLYLWSGTTTDYPILPATTYTCSVETDCDGTITVSSLDFRFSENDFSLTCIDDNVLTITDGSSSQEFRCATSNNNFEVQVLYSSSNNYITLTYTGNLAGGHLWLAFQASTNGNLSINCVSPSPINTCGSTTTTTTTEETITTEEVTTTAAPAATAEETTATTTEEAARTETDLSSVTTKSQFIIALVVLLVILAILIGIIIIYCVKLRRKKMKQKKHKENQKVSVGKNQTGDHRQMAVGNKTTSKETFTSMTSEYIQTPLMPTIRFNQKHKDNEVLKENIFPNEDTTSSAWNIETKNKSEKKKDKELEKE